MFRPILRNEFTRWVMVLCLGWSMQLFGQRPQNAADSLKAGIAEQRAAVAFADSTGDLPAAFAGRMRLVNRVGKTEAVQLLKQAAAIANDMGLPALGAMVRRDLARHLADAGNGLSAYKEAVLADSLERVSAARQQDSLNDQHALAMARLAADRDSSMQAGTERERRLAVALVAVQHYADRWMWIAFCVAGACVLILFGLLYRMGGTSRRLHASIDALRSEVDTLKKPVNRLKDPPVREVVVSSIPERSVHAEAAIALDEAMDPVVLAMFRKSAPERLGTLRRAREQGDPAKVVRVVHSLKPQLLSFDEERFAPLCARLMASGAEGNKPQWTADLDELEKAVSVLLDGMRH